MRRRNASVQRVTTPSGDIRKSLPLRPVVMSGLSVLMGGQVSGVGGCFHGGSDVALSRVFWCLEEPRARLRWADFAVSNDIFWLWKVWLVWSLVTGGNLAWEAPPSLAELLYQAWRTKSFVVVFLSRAPPKKLAVLGASEARGCTAPGPPVRNFDCGGQTLSSRRLAVTMAAYFHAFS